MIAFTALHSVGMVIVVLFTIFLIVFIYQSSCLK